MIAMGKRYGRFWFRGVAVLGAFFWFIHSPAAKADEAASSCGTGPSQAAARNAQSLNTMPLNLFGRPETGWAFYEPLVATELDTECPAASPGFAKALAQWQAAHGFPGAGTMNVETLTDMSRSWQARRPFVLISHHQCPDPPAEETLATATDSESYGGKTIQMRPDALAAYRQMVTAARKAGVLSAKNLLTIFSAYRSPDYDAERCAHEHNCQGVVRATCSAHRTALAMDVYLGSAPGFSPDSSADENRLFISRTPAYRWLVKHASHFGFANYPFEPWHWEFIGNGSEHQRKPAGVLDCASSESLRRGAYVQNAVNALSEASHPPRSKTSPRC